MALITIVKNGEGQVSVDDSAETVGWIPSELLRWSKKKNLKFWSLITFFLPLNGNETLYS